jgi:hypothetical protein
MRLTDTKWKLAVIGGVCGVLAVILALTGNPGNMAICVACFIRDIAGSLNLHTAGVVQYFRPEIVGFVCGSFLIALATREFRVTAGSSPAIRFLLGFIMMIGALVFLGCPLRMLIRMAAGDANAYVALVGFVAGIGTGCLFLKKGFSLGRSYEAKPANGYILPALLVIGLVVSVATTLFASSTEGPGSMRAPVLVALLVALVFGALAQKSRMCFAGGIRDVFLMRDFSLLSILGGMFVILLVFNIATGRFHFGFTGQPVAHAQHLWNFLGLYAVGFAAVLAGGCPLRQLILAGQGSTDSGITFLGLLVGAAFAHNFGLAGAAAKAATETEAAVAGGPGLNGKIALLCGIAVLFVVALTNLKKNKARDSG